MRTGTSLKIKAKVQPETAAITYVTVPAPPSVNALYRNLPGKGRVRTSTYKDWAGHAGWVLKSQAPPPVPGRVIIILGLERDSAAADIDNRVKALFDLLVTHKVIKDDKYVTAFAISWLPKGTSQARLAIMPACDLMLRFLTPDAGKSGGWFVHQEGQTHDGD